MSDPDPARRDPTETERLELAGQLLVSVGDVVDLLDGRNRKPWVVNQWRKRPEDPFPAPVRGGRSPQFHGDDVLTWLWDHDQLARDRPGPVWFWPQAVKLLPGAAKPADRTHLRSYLAALVEDVVAPGSVDPRLGPVVPDPDVVGLLRRTLTLALTVSAEPSTGSSAAELLDAGLAILGELFPESAVSHWLLVELVAAITGSWPGTAVLDPACGEALVLAELAASRRSLTAVAMELDPEAAATARVRFDLRSLPVDLRFGDAFGETFEDDVGAFDIVVLDPPTGRGVPGLGHWLTLVDRMLAPAGRAAVALPAGSLRANASAAEVLHRRQVSAVVLLPSLVRPTTRDTQALVVLEAAGGCEKVLVIDLRHVKHRDEATMTAAVAGLVNQQVSEPAGTGASIDAFTTQTGVRAWLLTTAEIVADGVLPAPATASVDLLARVADLEVVLAVDPQLTGSDKLQRALRIFANKHRRSDHDDR